MERGISGQAIYTLDPGGHVTSWNVGAERLHGYNAREIIGKHFSAFFCHADGHACLPGHILGASCKCGTASNMAKFVHKDGTEFWCRILAEIIHDERETPVGFTILIRDLRAEVYPSDDLLQSAHRLNLLSGNLPDFALYGLGPDGRVGDWNKGAAQLFGYAGDEAIAQPFSKFFVPGNQLKEPPEGLLARAAAQAPFATRGQCLRKDGTVFFANIVIDPVWEETGRCAGFAVLTRNITGKTEAQKMELIGELASFIAHDFKNLLAAISGTLELISDENPHPLIDIAKRASDRGTKLTSQLQAFAHAQSFSPQNANPNDLISDFELLLTRAGNGSIALRLDLSPELWSCDIDRVQFQSAILNLVWSGCDRMPIGGTLAIETKNVLIDSAAAGRQDTIPPGSYAVISLSEIPPDNAGDCGIASNKPISASDGADCAPRLNQVYDFVQASNGYLEWIPKPGQGPLARLYLPKSQAPIMIETAANAEAALSPLRTVLVVDDDPDVLEVTLMRLERLGYAVYSAKDGHEALEVLRASQPIDILFTDVRMPRGMDGIDLARHARSLHPSIHIVLASGDPRPVLHEIEALQENISFLAKPYSSSLLAEKLARLQL